jgi:molybdate transport system substrate-binding protein
MKSWSLSWALVAVVFGIASGFSVHATAINVFAAASLLESLQEIGKAYETSSGDAVVFNFGASSLLARQIKEGAPADLFFSADEAKMDALESEGFIEKATRRCVLSNALVIVVALEKGVSIEDPGDLARGKVRRLALAEPSTVPAGIYAREYLEKRGLWSKVQPKVVPLGNVRAALAAVESGNAEAGIVYRTDAAISKKVRVAYEVPASENPPISYPVAIVSNAKKPEAAARFLQFLESAEARGAFESHGFIVRHQQ